MSATPGDCITLACKVMRRDAVEHWFRLQNRSLSNLSPSSLLGTPEGCDRVHALLLTLAEGVTA